MVFGQEQKNKRGIKIYIKEIRWETKRGDKTMGDDETITIRNSKFGQNLVFFIAGAVFLISSAMGMFAGIYQGSIPTIILAVLGIALAIFLLGLVIVNIFLNNQTIIFRRTGISIIINRARHEINWADVKATKLLTETQTVGGVTLGQDIIGIYLKKELDLKVRNPAGFGVILAGKNWADYQPKANIYVRLNPLGWKRIENITAEFKEKLGVKLEDASYKE